MKQGFIKWNLVDDNDALDHIRSVFSGYIGNRQAVSRLTRASQSAWRNQRHLCNEQSFALLGPASTGKTLLAKLFAKSVGLPFCEIRPSAIKTTADILVKISECLEQKWCSGESVELIPQSDPNSTSTLKNYFMLPPMIIFIDEVHDLSDSVVQALLTATEKTDGIMEVVGAANNYTVNCKNVCWFIATTDRGLLFDAFDTRFSKILLNSYNSSEIAEIIKLNNASWSIEDCCLVAKYGGKIPREALSFASEVRLERELNTTSSFEEIVKIVADDNQINDFGLNKTQLKVLDVLYRSPASKSNLCRAVGCKEEELEKYILPSMTSLGNVEESLVIVSSRGYNITENGRAVLEGSKS